MYIDLDDKNDENDLNFENGGAAALYTY